MDRCNRTGLPFLAEAERGSLVGSQRADRGDIERASVIEIVSSPEGTAKLRSANQGLWPWTGAPCSPSVHGPKTDFSNAFIPCIKMLVLGRSPFAGIVRALEGAGPLFF